MFFSFSSFSFFGCCSPCWCILLLLLDLSDSEATAVGFVHFSPAFSDDKTVHPSIRPSVPSPALSRHKFSPFHIIILAVPSSSERERLRFVISLMGNQKRTNIRIRIRNCWMGGGNFFDFSWCRIIPKVMDTHTHGKEKPKRNGRRNWSSRAMSVFSRCCCYIHHRLQQFPDCRRHDSFRTKLKYKSIHQMPNDATIYNMLSVTFLRQSFIRSLFFLSLFFLVAVVPFFILILHLFWFSQSPVYIRTCRSIIRALRGERKKETRHTSYGNLSKFSSIKCKIKCYYSLCRGYK